MLVLQSGAFLIGLYLLLSRVMRPTRAAMAACLVMLFPPVVVPMMVIWKDCLMAGFLMLGAAAILHDRRGVRIAGLVALFAATAMRYNAPAATLPLILLGFEWARGQRWVVRYGTALGAWVAITALAFGLNAVLTHRKMHFWASTFAIADIAGTLAHVDTTIPDDKLRPLLAPTEIRIDHDYHETIRAKYLPETFTQLIGGDDRLWSVPIAGTTPMPTEQRHAIENAWSVITSEHRGAYIAYRFDAFAEVLGLRTKFSGASVMRRRTQTPERLAADGITWKSGYVQDRAERVLVFFARKTFLFRPYLWGLLALVLLPFARRHRDILALLMSGIFMELSLLPIAITPDYRYSHWLVVMAVLATVMLVAKRARPAT
jgi:hypothetical protein